MLSHLSWVQFFVTLWTIAHQASLSMAFSRQEYWMGGCHHSLLQRVFPTQGSNSGQQTGASQLLIWDTTSFAISASTLVAPLGPLAELLHLVVSLCFLSPLTPSPLPTTIHWFLRWPLLALIKMPSHVFLWPGKMLVIWCYVRKKREIQIVYLQ